jgi:hypothetical protein
VTFDTLDEVFEDDYNGFAMQLFTFHDILEQAQEVQQESD